MAYKMTFKLTADDTNGKYLLIEQNNEPGVGIPLHVHEDENKVFKVVEGQPELTIDGQKTLLGPGNVGFCPRGVSHTWQVKGTTNAKDDLSFFPAGMEIMFEKLAELPPGPPDMKRITEICNRFGVRFI
jgi:quercetin dioxygenase-like cupin family protein